MDTNKIRKIILEELKKVLKEMDEPAIDVGGRTTQEQEAHNLQMAVGTWAEQLTTIKYRQFLQQCLDILEYELGKQKAAPRYAQLLANIQDAVSKKENCSYQTAFYFDQMYNRGGEFKQALVNSGYKPWEH